jgi:hypothetical protein
LIRIRIYNTLRNQIIRKKARLLTQKLKNI